MTDTQLITVQLSDEESGLEATFVPGARHALLLAAPSRRGVARPERMAWTPTRDGARRWAYRCSIRGQTGSPAFDYSVAGKTVQVPHDPTRVALDDNGLPIHGVIGGRLGWELTDTPGPDTRSLEARLSWSEEQPELFEVFPFQHDLLYEARFTDGRLEIEVTVHASGEDVVPVAFGFHPYLAPGGPREHWLIELPAMRHLALDRQPDSDRPRRAADCPPNASSSSEREFDDGFDSVADPARFAVTAGERRIELELTDGYRARKSTRRWTGTSSASSR